MTPVTIIDSITDSNVIVAVQAALKDYKVKQEKAAAN